MKQVKKVIQISPPLSKGDVYRISNSLYQVLAYDRKAKTYSCKRIELCGVSLENEKPHTFNPDNLSIWIDFEIVKQENK
jgi:hypothetical protein